MYRSAFIGLILAVLVSFIIGLRYNTLPYLADTPVKDFQDNIVDRILVEQDHRHTSSGNALDADTDPPRRIVAIGDMHGDLENALKVLEFAGIIDQKGEWIALNTTLIQLGDVVDRGPDTKAIFELLRRFSNDSIAYGSNVIPLLGNHEIMNMFDDLRYVHPNDYDSFGGPQQRKIEWSQSGNLGKYLRSLDITAKVNATVFVHGGISVYWAKLGINFINHSARRSLWQQNQMEAHLDPVFGGEGPTWYREFAQTDEKTICPKVEEALTLLGARRMVIGHTPQLDGIKARCQGRVIIVDTGISKVYGGKLSALEIFGDTATALYQNGERVELPPSRPVSSL